MSGDVVDLIMSDHREVERLFEILEKQPEQRGMMLPVVSALLIAHSRAEEAEVYPAARDEAGASGTVSHSQHEHAEAEKLLDQLRRLDPDRAEFTSTLKQLVEAVKHHVEEEESSVLPAMRNGLDESRRQQLGKAFMESRAAHLGDPPGEATKADLQQQAENLGVSGAGSLSKQELREELNKGGES